MADCCEEDRRSPLELIPAGLDTIPRQAAGFPEVRLALLEAVAHHPARHRQRQACKHGQDRDEHEKRTRNRRTSQGPLCDDEPQSDTPQPRPQTASIVLVKAW